MALTFNNFIGFETGGLEEASSSSGSPDATEATIVRSGARSLKQAGGSAALYQFPVDAGIANAGNDHIIGFGVYFTDLSPGNDILILDDSASSFSLRLSTGGDLLLRRVSNITEITATTPLTVNTWHFIEIYWQNVNSTTVAAELFVDNVSVGTAATGKDWLAGSVLSHYRFRAPTDAGDGDFYIDDVYVLSGASSSSDRLGAFEVFGNQTSKASATPDAGMLGNAPTNLDAGQWADAGETPGTDAQVLSYDGSAEYGTVDLAFGDEIDGDSNIVAIKGIWRAEYTGGGSAAHSIGLGDGADVNAVPNQSVTLTTAPTAYFWLRATDLPTKAQGIRQGVANEGGRNLDLFEMWAMIAHVPDPPGTTFDQAISVTFTTTMVTETERIRVFSAAIGFVTTMVRTQKLDAFRAFNVGFGTAMNVVKKTTPVAKTISFITAMATTPIKTGIKAISVAFGTAFTLGKTTKLAKAVSFVTAMSRSTVKTAFKSIAVGFTTAFALTKKVLVTKPIAFVTSMSLATLFIEGVQTFTKTINVAFVTAITVAKTVKTTKTVGFVTTMALTRVTSFFRAFAVAFGTAFANVRKTKLTKTVAFVTTMSTTPVPIFVRVFNVAFTTTMSLVKTVRKTIAVAFVTAFSNVRKVSVTKAVAFVTTFALTTTALFAKALSVSFITTMVTTQFLTAFKALSVAFVTSMSLVKKVLKTITVGFVTGFGVEKLVRVVKQVPFVTSMVRTSVSTRFKTLAISFVTSMSVAQAKIFIKSLTFGFVTSFGITAARFISGNIVPTGAMLVVFLRRRRRNRDRR